MKQLFAVVCVVAMFLCLTFQAVYSTAEPSMETTGQLTSSQPQLLALGGDPDPPDPPDPLDNDPHGDPDT